MADIVMGISGIGGIFCNTADNGWKREENWGIIAKDVGTWVVFATVFVVPAVNVFYEINAQTGDIEIEIYKGKNCSSRNDTGGNLYDCTTAAEGGGTQNTDGWCDGTKHQRRDG